MINQILQAFIKSKQHKGNLAIGAYLTYNGTQGSYYKIYQGQASNNHSNSTNVLLVMRFLYKYYRNYPLRINLTRKNLVTIIHQLPHWKLNHWPVSEFSSNDMYQQSQQTRKPLTFKKIPSNYVSNIPNYKHIYEGLLFFTNGISFARVNSTNLIMQKLNRNLNMAVGSLPPTKEFLKKRAKTKSSNIRINIEPKYKQKFIQLSRKNHTDYKQFLHDAIVGYVKTHTAIHVPNPKPKPKAKSKQTAPTTKMSKNHHTKASKAKDSIKKISKKAKSKSKSKKSKKPKKSKTNHKSKSKKK